MKDRFFEVMMVITGIALVFGAIMFFTSCSGPVKQLAKIQANHPAVLAKACADWYPGVITKDSTVIRYIKGKDVLGPVQYVTVDCDSASAAANASPAGIGTPRRVLVNIPCPPSITRVDTTQYSRYLEKESTAKLAVKEAELADTRGQLEVSDRRADDNEAKFKTWRKRAYWAWGILAGLGVFAIVKLYLKFKPF